jgi:hypothetical protein
MTVIQNRWLLIMTTKTITKKTKKIAVPIIHIRVKKNVTYFVNDNIRIAVTSAEVVNKKNKDATKDLA